MKNSRNTALLLSVTAIALLSNTAFGQENSAPKFASVFTNNAVLQRDKPISVWGTAKPNANLTLRISSQSLNIVADANGKWNAQVSPMSGGNNLTLSISDGTAKSEISNIAIGDVFLCSGQSNMEFQQKYATNSYNDNTYANNPNIRYININKQTAISPRDELEIKSNWVSINPTTVLDASSVCYHLAEEINKSQKVTIGMINSSWGGTAIETWISQKNLMSVPEYKSSFEALKIYASDKEKGVEAWSETTKAFWENAEPDGKTKLVWKNPEYDDKDWGAINPNDNWENQNIKPLLNFDGMLWYRAKINLTEAQANNASKISLGPIDDADLTFLNGVNIGNTNGYNDPRVYKIPKNTLHAGENTIAIRILDNTGGGGMHGAPDTQFIELNNGEKLPLVTKWKYKISAPINQVGSLPNNPWDPITGAGILNNAMIAPIAPYTLKGVAWYQGEANTGNAAKYDGRLALMFKDWREQFKDNKLPFFIVQLANYGGTSSYPVDSGWAIVRDAQRRVVTNDANAGLAVSIDIGDRYDIHPTQKTWVGKRLAKSALNLLYNQTGTRTGPIPLKAYRDKTSVKIDFAGTNGALVAYSSKSPIGFELCSDKCEYANASISANSVILTGANAAKATKIRYAWSDAPVVNLYSSDDLPVTPFEINIK